MPADPGKSLLANSSALPWTRLALLFVGSGTAALIYEVVWLHLLRLVIGGSSISLGILLASFMGGMSIGSLGYSSVVSPRYHPLRVYAVLEFAIGAIGCTMPWWLPTVGQWYLAGANQWAGAVAPRAIVAGVCLLPVTILMGATLPAIARWVKATPDGLSHLGVFYGANTFGAVLGCLSAGFILLPQTDVMVASYVAAGINFLVGAIAWVMARNLAYEPPAEALQHSSPSEDTSPADRGGGLLGIRRSLENAPAVILVVIGLSGFAALGAEVVWTRLLSLLFGVTVYTFSIILAVFLAGIGLGSTFAARWIKYSNDPLKWLAGCQLGIALLAVWANFFITQVLAFWRRPIIYQTSDIYALFAHDTMRTLVAVLPSAILWGASFSIALAAAGRGRRDASRLVGQIYAANTLGAVFGALVTSAVLVPWLGSQRSQQAMVLASVVAAALVVWARERELASAPTDKPKMSKRKQRRQPKPAPSPLLGRLVVVMVLLIGVGFIKAPPHGMLARPLQPAWWIEELVHLYEREGRNATVVVQEDYTGTYRYICIGGKVEASNIDTDLRCQRLLGHLPALVHDRPLKTLTVGMGTGTTAGCFVLYPEIEDITICEIEPAVKEAAARFFVKENHGVVDDPRTLIRFDDARHFLSTTDEKFDIITSDPINSWVKGAAALYSVEYYELCKRRLNPGGVMVQWIPFYEKDLETVKCELATFLSVYPQAMLWTSYAPQDDAELHDIIAVAQLDPTPIDLKHVERRIEANPRLKAALDELGIGTIVGLMGQYAGRGKDVAPWLEGVEVNRDLSLRLEYLAGLSLWVNESDKYFREMVQYRRYPADSLKNDEEYEAAIRRRLGLPESEPNGE